jgi:protein SCO1/2/putative membrane protein
VNPSYRLGNLIVLGAVFLALGVCLLFVRPFPAPAPAAQDLGDMGWSLGPFRLVERSGRAVTDADLADRVWVAAFVFTRCPLSCPRISSVMKGLQGKLEGTGVRLVSITVDPEHDTPAVLAAYADRFGAHPNRWWFLTGPKGDVLALIRDRFKLGVEPASEADQRLGAEAFAHSERLALVDRGRVVGYYSSTDPKAVAALVAEARRRDPGPPPAWVKRLPAVNAGLNATCACLLALGWVLIRSGNRRGHAAAMTAGVVVSTFFLACYLVYHSKAGSVPFRGVGPVRLVYFTVLLSHTLLATFGVVPLVALTFLHALRRRFDRHARLARVTFPVWLYVSVTGVVIYVMLYQWPVATALPSH